MSLVSIYESIWLHPALTLPGCLSPSTDKAKQKTGLPWLDNDENWDGELERVFSYVPLEGKAKDRLAADDFEYYIKWSNGNKLVSERTKWDRLSQQQVEIAADQPHHHMNLVTPFMMHENGGLYWVLERHRAKWPSRLVRILEQLSVVLVSYIAIDSAIMKALYSGKKLPYNPFLNERLNGRMPLEGRSLVLPFSKSLQRMGVRGLSSYGRPDQMCVAVFRAAFFSAFVISNPWERQAGDVELSIAGGGWEWLPVHLQTHGSKSLLLPGISICLNTGIIDSGCCLSGGVLAPRRSKFSLIQPGSKEWLAAFAASPMQAAAAAAAAASTARGAAGVAAQFVPQAPTSDAAEAGPITSGAQASRAAAELIEQLTASAVGLTAELTAAAPSLTEKPAGVEHCSAATGNMAVATTNSTGGGSAAAAVKTPQQQPGTAIASKPVHVVQRCRAMKQGRKRVAQQEQQQQELQDATNLPKRIRLPEE